MRVGAKEELFDRAQAARARRVRRTHSNGDIVWIKSVAHNWLRCDKDLSHTQVDDGVSLTQTWT